VPTAHPAPQRDEVARKPTPLPLYRLHFVPAFMQFFFIFIKDDGKRKHIPIHLSKIAFVFAHPMICFSKEKSTSNHAHDD
jgi:hypothetical protein